MDRVVDGVHRTLKTEREIDKLDDDRDQTSPFEYSDGYGFEGHDWEQDPDWGP